MRHLVLHIGHGKTGTSYIQSVLALNSTNLLGLNIKYPDHPSLYKAMLGNVTSGNGELILEDGFNDVISSDILLSSESLFHALLSNNQFEEKVIRNFKEVTVILYTRNVYDLNISVWGQLVKREGLKISLSDYIKEKKDMHYRKILQWLDISLNYKFQLKIYNYSNHSKELLNHFFSIIAETLGLDPQQFEKFRIPAQTSVNRSLSLAEYNLIRTLNNINPKIGYKSSDFLVNQLPFVPSYNPTIDAATRATLADKYGAEIANINQYLAASEFLEI